MVTLEEILDEDNLRRAIKQVQRNKGAAGIDGVPATLAPIWCEKHLQALTKSVQNGTYVPSPIKRVYIPKPNGEKRPLGISTVGDRILQTALANVLAGKYDSSFSESSHGFRPFRGCQTAIAQAIEFAHDGYVHVVDMDLRKFFDTVNHSKLLRTLSKRVKDGRVISLIGRMLRAKVTDGTSTIKTTIGIPQGNSASPVLANILLDILDKELEARGHKFVRYADDMMIFCRSQRAAERVLVNITKFIEGSILLKVNREKTSTRKLGRDVKFLGFGFYKSRNDEEYKPCVHKKSKERLFTKLKEILNRKCAKGLEATKEALRQCITGWVAYFKPGLYKSLIYEIDGRIRRRVRQIYIKIWKRNWTRYKNMLAIPGRASATQRAMVAFVSRGYWARSRTCNFVMTSNWLQKEGWSWVAQLLKV